MTSFMSVSEQSDSGSSARSRTSGNSGLLSSTSSRSDLVSQYEQKYRHKKEQQRKQQLQAMVTAIQSNQLQVASEEKRQRQREAERTARRKLMETWLTDPKVLRRRERLTRRRHDQELKKLQQWFPYQTQMQDGVAFCTMVTDSQSFSCSLPSCSAATEEKGSSSSPPPEAIAHEQLAAFCGTLDHLKQRVSHIEDIEKEVRVTAGFGTPTKRRRLCRSRGTRLQPLPWMHHDSGPAITRSNSIAVPRHQLRPATLRPNLVASMSMDSWQTSALNCEPDEEDQQVEAYLARQRVKFKMLKAVSVIQSFWRMTRKRRKYLRWYRRRVKRRAHVLRRWNDFFRFRKKLRFNMMRRFTLSWKEEIDTSVRLREIELKLFESFSMHAELSNIVVNLFFTSSRMSLRNESGPTAANEQDSLPSSFINSAFASVGAEVETTRSRIQKLKLQHAEIHKVIGKKIVHRIFVEWRKAHMAYKRISLNAQLCIKRAARMVVGKPAWPMEKLVLCFEIWNRWTAFKRCKRLGTPIPHYRVAFPFWDAWLQRYQERQIRRVKAASKAPFARMRRYFTAIVRFWSYRKAKQELWEFSVRFADETLMRKVLLEWREAIAESAFKRKLCRLAFQKLKKYRLLKLQNRPKRRAVEALSLRFDYQRFWTAWKSVKLTTELRREFAVRRLQRHIKERRFVQRILIDWVGLRSQRVKMATFRGWWNLINRRKLLLTLKWNCNRIRRNHLLSAVFRSWQAVVWKKTEIILEDELVLTAWNVYADVSAAIPDLFRGNHLDAHVIFGGIPEEKDDPEHDDDSSVDSAQEDDDKDLATDDRNYNRLVVRRNKLIVTIQNIIMKGSRTEIQSVLMKNRHLINMPEAKTGNTLLHTACQLEEGYRRLEVTRILLSEGATTVYKRNNQGQMPKDLAPNDLKLHELLDIGVYKFFSKGILKTRRKMPTKGASDEHEAQDSIDGKSSDDESSKPLWCIFVLMLVEWVRSERQRRAVGFEWHSVLKQGLWLRRERFLMSSTSLFTDSIVASRSLVFGMHQRVCVGKHEFVKRSILTDGAIASSGREHLTRQQSALVISRDCKKVDPFPVELFFEIPSRNHKPATKSVEIFSEFGDLNSCDTATPRNVKENRYIWGEFHDYAQLIQSGTLNYRPCEARLVREFVGLLFCLDFDPVRIAEEGNLLAVRCDELHTQIMAAYDSILKVERQFRDLSDTGIGGIVPQLCLIRFFASEEETKAFFEQEIALLDTQLAVMAKLSTSKDPTSSLDNSVLLHKLEELLVQERRKLRREEKKRKKAEETLQANQRCFLRAVQKPPSDRSLHEIIQCGTELEKARFEMARLVERSVRQERKLAELDNLRQLLHGHDTRAFVSLLGGRKSEESIVYEKQHLMEEYAKQQLLHQSLKAGHEEQVMQYRTRAREMRRIATQAVHELLVTNLIRACCFFLVENLVALADGDQQQQAIESLLLASESELSSKNAQLLKQGSVAAVRKVIETLSRNMDLETLDEEEVGAMKATYSTSLALLFEKEREQLSVAKQVQTEIDRKMPPRFEEMNPLTGQTEEPPNHLLDLDNLEEVLAHQLEQNSTKVPINKKKRELQMAIRLNQLPKREVVDQQEERAQRAQEADELKRRNTVDARVFGDSCAFGNFVLCLQEAPPTPTPSTASVQPPWGPIESDFNIDIMWRQPEKRTEMRTNYIKLSSGLARTKEAEPGANSSVQGAMSDTKTMPPSLAVVAGTEGRPTPQVALEGSPVSGLPADSQTDGASNEGVYSEETVDNTPDACVETDETQQDSYDDAELERTFDDSSSDDKVRPGPQDDSCQDGLVAIEPTADELHDTSINPQLGLADVPRLQHEPTSEPANSNPQGIEVSDDSGLHAEEVNTHENEPVQAEAHAESPMDDLTQQKTRTESEGNEPPQQIADPQKQAKLSADPVCVTTAAERQSGDDDSETTQLVVLDAATTAPKQPASSSTATGVPTDSSDQTMLERTLSEYLEKLTAQSLIADLSADLKARRRKRVVTSEPHTHTRSKPKPVVNHFEKTVKWDHGDESETLASREMIFQCRSYSTLSATPSTLSSQSLESERQAVSTQAAPTDSVTETSEGFKPDSLDLQVQGKSVTLDNKRSLVRAVKCAKPVTSAALVVCREEESKKGASAKQDDPSEEDNAISETSECAQLEVGDCETNLTQAPTVEYANQPNKSVNPERIVTAALRGAKIPETYSELAKDVEPSIASSIPIMDPPPSREIKQPPRIAIRIGKHTEQPSKSSRASLSPQKSSNTSNSSARFVHLLGLESDHARSTVSLNQIHINGSTLDKLEKRQGEEKDETTAVVGRLALKRNTSTDSIETVVAHAPINDDTHLELIGNKMRTCLVEQKAQDAEAKQKAKELEPQTKELSKDERMQIWCSFTSALLSPAVAHAYAVVYPNTYSEVAEPLEDALPGGVGSPRIHQVSEELLEFGSEFSAKSLLDVPDADADEQMDRDTSFWKAAECYRSIHESAILNMTDKDALIRRKARALAIYEEYMRPTGRKWLSWLRMYACEVKKVKKALKKAPLDLFDALQQTAQLRISLNHHSNEQAMEEEASDDLF